MTQRLQQDSRGPWAPRVRDSFGKLPQSHTVQGVGFRGWVIVIIKSSIKVLILMIIVVLVVVSNCNSSSSNSNSNSNSNGNSNSNSNGGLGPLGTFLSSSIDACMSSNRPG